MIILSWNCRGLGQPSAVPSLRDLVRCHKPDVVFLCETLSTSIRMEEVKRQLGFECCVVVDCQGRSGGLAMLWNRSNLCELISYSRN